MVLKYVLLVSRNTQFEFVLPHLNTYSLLDALKYFLMAELEKILKFI